MIKKIRIDQLKIGMFVHDINCGWTDHPYVRNNFTIESERDLRQIHQLGVREVFIDTDHGEDAQPDPDTTTLSADADHVHPLAKASQDESSSPLSKEMPRMTQIYREAIAAVETLIENAREDQPPDLAPLRQSAHQITGSILRNHDAGLALTRVRQPARYLYEHSVNVSIFMSAFAKSMCLERDLIEELALGALLLDIGNALISEKILNKPGQLNTDEMAVIRSHPDYGLDLLRGVPDLSPMAMAVVFEHHERFDGSGYPMGKSGKEISLYGRMAAIVDVYDAVTADRPYRLGIEPHRGLRSLLDMTGTHFDEWLVHQFVRTIGIYPIGTLVRLTNSEIGVVVEMGRKNLLKPIVRILVNNRQHQIHATYDLNLETSPQKVRILRAESRPHWKIRPEALLQPNPGSVGTSN